MEPLAKLPVFWALEERRVVVCGGTDAAAWKAELLAACGARVDIYAEEAGDTLGALLARPPVHPAASLVHHDRRWQERDLAGAALAIADCEDDVEARRFFDAALAAGIPVNVIDRPAFCQFQFGSIVNRSPVIVAISTDGAAPILAQAIRRRIEALLPHSLKAWAALARSLRERVHQRLAPGERRRVFWERFADRVFATMDVPEEGAGEALFADAEKLAQAPAIGRVTWVGAGPGDAELLTLKAVRALQAADVILFDDLVSHAVLELARREAKRLMVTECGGRDDIAGLMTRLAKAGNRVVRVTFGDPLASGVVGAAIARLARENILVDVVPGISAERALAARRTPASDIKAVENRRVAMGAC